MAMPPDEPINPFVDDSIRESAAIHARLAAIELINREVKPALDALAKPNWSLYAAWVSAFMVFMAFYAALERSIQSSGAEANRISIQHTDMHLKDLEDKLKEVRRYADERDNELRSEMFTKRDHDIFDKERSIELQEVMNRLTWLEHRPTK